jgi:putative N6-adenine methyltransferase
MTVVDQSQRADFRRWVARRLTEAFRIFGNLPRSEYRMIVAELVATLTSAWLPDNEVYGMSMGAFPTVVKATLAELARGAPSLAEEWPGERTPASETAPWEAEELDPVDAQWYFDLASVERIVSHIPLDAGSVVALGAPTVAAAVASERPPCEVTLVDISPRFMAHDAPGWVGGLGIDFVTHNLDEKPYTGVEDADVVVMDPPWYIENYRAWLHSAVATCRKDGLIAVVLPQLLTNRRSLPERREIMGHLRTIGPVSVMYGALRYVTPSFELPILASEGLGFLHRWRRADLALVQARKRELPCVFPSLTDIEWRRRVVSNLVVRSYGESERGSPVPVIGPPQGGHGYLLAGVGRNYLWSSDANLVTSRGRAATVQHWGRLPHILDLLEAGGPLEQSVARAGLSLTDHQPLVGILHTLLDR